MPPETVLPETVLPETVLPETVLPDSRSVAVLFDDDSPARIDAARRVACQVVAGQVGGSLGERPQCRLRRVQPVERNGDDPYAMTELLPSLGVDAAVLVVPRRRGSRRSLPGPVVAGVPVGILQADHCGHLSVRPGRPDATSHWVVAAMAKNVFLSASDDWASRLADVHQVIDLRADRARRDDLLGGLAAGPGIVLYAGHGSPRGWAGYQALRIEHVIDAQGPEAAPAGLVMAFACKTLARHRARWPFGSALVQTGAARAYLAPATTVFTADAERLAEIVIDILVEAGSSELRVWDLMRQIECRATQDDAASRAWATFRLIGDPLTPLV